MVQFYSPEGMMLDSLFRDNATGPSLSLRTGGFFLSYYDFQQDRQILVWLNESGGIEREQLLDLVGVDYAYVEGDQVKLIVFTQDGWTWAESFTAYTFDAQGNPVGVDTLLYRVLNDNELHGGHAYLVVEGRLTLLTSIARTDLTPTEFTSRLVHYQARMVTESGPWNPGPIAPGCGIAFWTLAPGPWNSTLVEFYVSGPGVSELHALALDAWGTRTESARVLPLPLGFAVNGLAMLEAGGSVYSCFTHNSTDGILPGGAFLAAFPLDEILATDPASPALPQTWQLAAYPNPFNAAVHLDFTAPVAGPVALHIFDITGRLVETRTLSATPGRGRLTWTASGLATGVYFARWSAPGHTQLLKLYLLR